MTKKSITLIGMPGIGKTTLAMQLSDEFVVPNVDIDNVIEQTYEMSIPDIISTKGIEFFRCYEALVLRRYNFTQRAIIASGGGAPCYHNNMAYLLLHSNVIYLKASVNQLVDMYERYNITRPLSRGQNIEEYLSKTLQQRTTYYERAHYVVTYNDLSSMRKMIESILQH